MGKQDFKLSVVVPAYNEHYRISSSLLRMSEYLDAQDYEYEIIVVNDGSSDDTCKVVEKIAENHDKISLLSYDENKGKGCAVRLGMLKAQGEYILFSDADLAAPIEEIEKLLPPVLTGAQVAIGSRPLKESNLLVHQPWYREFAGRMFNKAVQLLAVKGIQDTQCGFKLFRREAAHLIFAKCKLNGFSFDFEALFLARKLGYTIAEVPIKWAHQPGSKVRLLRDGSRMIRDLVWMRFFMIVTRPIVARVKG